MPETITEMIIPGVYIEVRAEGLTGVAGISLANVGVVGTANRGAVGQVQVLSGAGEVKAAFGTAGAHTGSEGDLSLVRALDLLFASGARTVYAVRVAKDAAPAQFQLRNADKVTATLTAKTPGDWADNLAVVVAPATEDVLVKESLAPTGTGALTVKRTPIADERTVVRIVDRGRQVHFTGTDLFGTTGASAVGNTAVKARFDAKKLILTGMDPLSPSAVVEVTYAVDKAQAAQVTIQYEGATERYLAPDGAYLADLINATSRFVTAAAGTAANSLLTPAAVQAQAGANGTAGDTEYQAGLDALLHQDVHILCAPGISTLSAYAQLAAHCQSAVENGRERIAVVGTDVAALQSSGEADAEYAQKVANQAAVMGNDRVIFVAPGIQTTDRVTGKQISVTGAYAAAAVAGLISRLSPHVSPTNKELGGVLGLERELTPGEIKQLLNQRIMVLNKQNGFRVVRGISTSEAPWSQVTTRRIVDYAKLGVRKGAQAYIGRLNNDRVRKALKGTLDGFLTSMVKDEMLTAYQLEVDATRDDEINNRCTVTVMLRPTFSIDYVKVIMNLE